MPWTCPACHQSIRHDGAERQPHAGAMYRCHVCRLDLVWERNEQKLMAVERPPDPPQGTPSSNRSPR